MGKALATGKNPLKCTLKEPQVGAANEIVMDSPTACNSQKLRNRLILAALDSKGQPVRLPLMTQ